MQKEIEVNIKGRVQMVMFRDFARRYAKRLELTGVVKNLGDGSVRVVAQGDEDKLNKFIELLKKGPTFAKVSDIDVKWMEIKEKFTDFKIIWT
ncbi:MAG: acylphosphatase [Candidatus Pacebacteria bacterium]|jgi:acylphosphatase|nr:acylphosphatase [Parcubacteria group bacterium]MDP7159425.1 acylphosphatase [Candidatus Paceibacterota bacterium]MDP7366545.1 acylphosphatase [Candidatus Paceibacterota bacterium]MDP7466407.1 acylphosphatase [Candidatus Paceibacterota bacterium]MDP7648403.1 acylphosphatase [Candidatus Paceibacterota bacterium]|tara:strand:+ start:126 stop:404 length:279 start_codon:yes stop_codon:yes gene_type:complete